MASAQDRLALLQRSWTCVAEGYNRLFVPRFMPWTLDTLNLLAGKALPAGTIAVPCCGPGQELPLVAAAFPRHRVVGIDLAEGMVEMARQLVDSQGLGTRVEMPQPAEVLASWTRALHPGGVLSVCFWPPTVEERGPWKRLADITPRFKPPGQWDADIPGAALLEGAELLQDSRPAHEMAWPSVAVFWESMTRAGEPASPSACTTPALLQHGEQRLEEMRRHFMEAYPDPEAPLSHTPAARLICLRRLVASSL
ncbi:hypothetical protein CHLNCDRAFT_138504 [Chlorella variabilis]|uniref:Methyltransferase domain-containing protein n=1 Tax=Chlorella variabilis TaxID=554065 RepID=E1ZN70_CHLVA|nr:hypothetical protein CHLNCDRAFT_138504 [Chlorella variabilis]EFN52919.1 hypothetical protein CHLNCDRAFT_138504 [Chlorella variabilis]|eukprot:XP_005845021.1 hypothetical protein CHLNCDRAFT_138504 [Chlorella variabilis]